MKTFTTLLTLSLLALSTASFAYVEENRPDKKSIVAVAISVWESPEIEAPELLKFLKAKNAYVPVAPFVWGNVSEAPTELLMVPVSPFVYGDSSEEAPKKFELKKAKYTTVPVAPFIWGDAPEAPDKLSVK